MDDKLLTLGQDEITTNPAHRTILSEGIAIAIVLDLILVAILVGVHRHAVMREGPARQEGISAFVNVAPVPTGTTGAQPTPKPRPASRAPAVAPSSQIAASIAESPEPEQAAQGGAPVRMTPGDLQLINRVEPVYPRLMIAARVEGTVVLDAIIHADGTIGDVTVLKSLGALFDRSAIDAVKRWRYTPIGHEGVVTVTVNFSLR